MVENCSIDSPGAKSSGDRVQLVRLHLVKNATSTFFSFKMADAGPLLHLATNLVKASAVARTTLGRRAIDLSAASRSPRMLVTSNKMC